LDFGFGLRESWRRWGLAQSAPCFPIHWALEHHARSACLCQAGLQQPPAEIGLIFTVVELIQPASQYAFPESISYFGPKQHNAPISRPYFTHTCLAQIVPLARQEQPISGLSSLFPRPRSARSEPRSCALQALWVPESEMRCC